MIGALKRAYANFRGFDTTSSAVPPMEGPLRPNTVLDGLPVALTLPDVDNLITTPDGLICSSGADLLYLKKAGAKGKKAKITKATLAVAKTKTLDASISALASDGTNAIAVGLDTGSVLIIGGPHDGTELRTLNGNPINCPTDLLFIGSDSLVISNGSTKFNPSQWKHDLMSKGESGSIWRVDLTAKPKTEIAKKVADNLAFPMGLALRQDGGLYVSEAWNHRVIAVDIDGGNQHVVLEDLPAYPARLANAADGGFWLSMFAPRNPLVEFVLLEKLYRQQMMDTIDSDYWIAPNLAPSVSFLQPIQGGARKMLNRLKPWSPSFSYGLLSYCDAEMQPRSSLHSRADGTVHGINSLCEADGVLFIAAKGSGLIVTAKSTAAAGGKA